MSAGVKMYKLSPIIRYDLPVELPKCMYKLKNVHVSHSPAGGEVASSADQQPSSTRSQPFLDQSLQRVEGMAELQERQEKIIQELEVLRRMVQEIRDNIGAVPVVAKKLPTKPLELSEVVINANPNSPPYSLEFAQRLLQDSLQISISSHLHSSVTKLPPQAQALAEKLTNFTAKSSAPKLHVRLIWKNITSNSELVISMLPLQGEVNILRYLANLCDNSLSYDSLETDSLLDLAHLIANTKNKSDKNKLLASLVKDLGKKPFLGGQQANIADLALSSAIKQSMDSKDINATLAKWMQRCETC